MIDITIPDIESDQTFAMMSGLSGPEEVFRLCREASEDIRAWLVASGFNKDILDRLRFESLIVPYMFACRRSGERRGEMKSASILGALFPID